MDSATKTSTFKLDTSKESIYGGLSALGVLLIIKLFGGGLVIGALAGAAVYASFYTQGWKRIVGIVVAVSLIGMGILFQTNNIDDGSGNQIISGEVRSNFVNSAIQSCIEKQTNLPENEGIAVSDLNAYCSCNANRLADLITLDELREADRTGVLPSVVQQNMEAVSNQCIDEIFGTAQ